MLKSAFALRSALGASLIGLSLSIAPLNVANAQQMCGKRTEVVHSLGAKYKEATTGVGLVNNGMVVEVLTSVTGSWTILMTRTNGVACVLATGESWEAVDTSTDKEPSA